jgi:hypothetical protein
MANSGGYTDLLERGGGRIVENICDLDTSDSEKGTDCKRRHLPARHSGEVVNELGQSSSDDWNKGLQWLFGNFPMIVETVLLFPGQHFQ